jgi:hypothetical protein
MSRVATWTDCSVLVGTLGVVVVAAVAAAAGGLARSGSAMELSPKVAPSEDDGGSFDLNPCLNAFAAPSVVFIGRVDSLSVAVSGTTEFESSVAPSDVDGGSFAFNPCLNAIAAPSVVLIGRDDSRSVLVSCSEFESLNGSAAETAGSASTASVGRLCCRVEFGENGAVFNGRSSTGGSGGDDETGSNGDDTAASVFEFEFGGCCC